MKVVLLLLLVAVGAAKEGPVIEDPEQDMPDTDRKLQGGNYGGYGYGGYGGYQGYHGGYPGGYPGGYYGGYHGKFNTIRKCIRKLPSPTNAASSFYDLLGYGRYPPYFYCYYGYCPYYGFYGPWLPPVYPEPITPPPIAVGRPFRRELNGESMSAEILIGSEEERLWSMQETVPIDSPNLRSSADSAAASEWSMRAAGEHASIASFASFTISLMTNQAPPILIRDALQAALDELNHAQVSFEMASLFGGQVIEPGALPDSKLSFSKNLTALAFGAAQEGCIDETLSALELAADAKNMLDSNVQGLSEAARDATWKIAVDESRHSMLAWRTIEWICAVDKKVCDQVMKEVLNPVSMHKACERRFPGRDDIRSAWVKIVDELPLAITAGTPKCPADQPLSVEDGASAIAAYISRGVVCSGTSK